MKIALQELSFEQAAMVAGGCEPGSPPHPDCPNFLTEQFDYSNRIVGRWMAEDPAFAAQMNQNMADAMLSAALADGSVQPLDPNTNNGHTGLVWNSPEAGAIVRAYYEAHAGPNGNVTLYPGWWD